MQEKIYIATHMATGEEIIGTEKEIREKVEIKQKAKFETLSSPYYPIKGMWLIKKASVVVPRKAVEKRNRLTEEDLAEWNEVRYKARKALIMMAKKR